MDYPPEYIMKNRQALIINIVTGKREGSDVDETALIDTLETLGYHNVNDVERHLNGADIIPKIEERAAQNCDSFICCILADGDKGTIKGSDGKTVNIAEISLALQKINSLEGQPKILFVQVWQESSTAAQENIPSSVYLEGGNMHKDFFYGFTATVQDSKYGSLYIQNLCDVIKRRHKHEDLLTMMTRIQKIVSDVSPGSRNYQQHPQQVSSLRMAVNF